MLKRIGLKTAVLGHLQLNTPDGFGIAAKVMKDAHCDFPLLEILQRLQSRHVDPPLIQKLQSDCITYIDTLQAKYANRDAIPPAYGVMMSLKILSTLETFPSVSLYLEGKKLCETALQLHPSEDPYPFLAQLRDAYGTLKVSQIKSVVQANPSGFDV